MTRYGTANIPYCPTAARLFCLFSAWHSFPSNLDSLKPYPSAHEAIPLDFLHDLAPMHLVDASLVGVSLVYPVVLTYLCPHEYAHTCMHTSSNPQGFQNAAHSWSRYFTKHHRQRSPSSETFVILMTVANLKSETIPILQTDISTVNNVFPTHPNSSSRISHSWGRYTVIYYLELWFHLSS